MDQVREFEEQVKKNVAGLGRDKELKDLAYAWHMKALDYSYSYNFRWLGRPIIQEPQDIVALQELVWREKPDLIIDCGIAHGGSLVLHASMLALLEMEECYATGKNFDMWNPKRMVVGLDIDIREHNKKAILAHPMSTRIKMIEGSSVAPEVVNQVAEIASSYSKVFVCLDSSHTHDHVMKELQAYCPLVSVGSYCVVFDTGIEDVPDHLFKDRPWGKGNNPKTAVIEFLKTHKEFEVDSDIENKITITAAPGGYLRRLK